MSSRIETFYQYDPDLGFMVRPYANGSNKFGFNDRDYSLRKRPDSFRILVLGDSFSWAGGKENNYTAILERLFEQYYGEHRVDIINAGYPMTGPGEQLALLKKYGIKYNPDLVILGFFSGNDILDSDPDKKRIVFADVYIDIDKRFEFQLFGKPVFTGAILFNFAKKSFILSREYLYGLREKISYAKKPKSTFDIKDKKVISEDKEGAFSKRAFLKIEKKRLDAFDKTKASLGYYDKRMQYAGDSIIEMKKFLQEHGSKLIVALYPDEFQVSEELLDSLFQYYNLNPKNYDLRLVQDSIIKRLKASDITYIDFFEEFRAQGKRTSLYLPKNTHWNDEGRRLAASILFRFTNPKVKKKIKTPQEKINLKRR